jgi:hypothetical protein
LSLQLGGGGELSCFQFANAGFEAVNAARRTRVPFEFFHQALQLVGHFSDPVETSVQQCGRFIAGHRPVAAVGAVGVTSDAAVALDQVAQCLISPVGWVNVGELGDAGDLLASGRVVRNTVDVELSGVCSAGARRPRAAGATQKLLEQFHYRSISGSETAFLARGWPQAGLSMEMTIHY